MMAASLPLGALPAPRGVRHAALPARRALGGSSRGALAPLKASFPRGMRSSGGLNNPPGRRNPPATRAVFRPFMEPIGSPSNEKCLSIPMSFYDVLGCKPTATAEFINVACDDLLRDEGNTGFSMSARVAREDVVNSIRRTLSSGGSRKAYDKVLEQDSLVEIPFSKVAGCLALLQEVGLTDAAESTGLKFLQEPGTRDYRADAAVAVALSYCEAGRKDMARNPPQVASGCGKLEKALKLLQTEGGRTLAPDLQEQIDSTLEVMAPRCVLELLALPITQQNETRRMEGLSGLRIVLWGMGAQAQGVTDRAEFLRTAQQYMSAAEQVSLFQETPSRVPAEPNEVYNAALAHIAEGFKSRRVRLIQDAEMLLANLDLSDGPDQPPSSKAAGDSTLERGMCAMLLGRLDDAEEILGITIGGGDPGIREFVLNNSPSPADTLPGMYLMTDRWVLEALLPRFRDCQGLDMSLRSWYDDPKVQRALETLDRGLLGRVTGGVAAFGTGLGNALGTMFKEPAPAPPSAPEPEARRGPIRQKMPLPTGGEAPAAAAAIASPADAPAAGTGADADVGASAGGEGAEEQERGADADADGAEGLGDAEDEGEGAVGGGDGGEDGAGEDPVVAEAKASAAAAVAMIESGEGEGEDEGEGMGVGGKIAALVGGAALVVLVLMSKLARSNPALAPFYDHAGPAVDSMTSGLTSLKYALRGERVPVTINKDGKAVSVAAKKPAMMDKVQAERIVRQWQSVKASALGSGHNVALLDSVLEGPMLTQWRSRAVDVKSHGWYWEYNLVGLKIDKVECNEAGTRAMVEATLQEAAQLYDQSKPDNNDSYRSTYCARYEMLRRSNGWRIVGGQVLY